MSASADGARTHEQVERFELPEADAAALIGRGGSRLGEVRRRAAGASIHLSAGGSSSGRRVLQLRGSVEAIGTAVSLIEKELCAPLRRSADLSMPANPPPDAGHSNAASLRPPPPPHEPPRIWPMFRAYAAVAGKPMPSVAQPREPLAMVPPEPQPQACKLVTLAPPARRPGGRKARVPFTAAEERALRAGFAKHGAQWARILAESPGAFHRSRTSVNLKDKARTMRLL